MNKNTINQEIELAYEALSDSGIAVNGKIDKAFRGQISSFGAAVTMGSLLSAIAFFSDKGSASVDRTCLMDAILRILKKENKAPDNCRNLFSYARQGGDNCREDIINAAIALKLAMNLYQLDKQE